MTTRRTPYPHPTDATALCVPLTRGYTAVIDARHGEAIAKYQWSASTSSGGPYAQAYIGGGRQTGPIQLHVFVARLEGITGVQVDHRDGDGLNCRAYNLRPATTAQNQHNARRRKDNTSGVKGVSRHMASGKWRATIRANGKVRHLGTFADIDGARVAVDSARAELHGEFANDGDPIEKGGGE